MKNLAIMTDDGAKIDVIENATIELFNQFVKKNIHCVLIDMDTEPGLGEDIIASHSNGKLKFYKKI